MASNVTQDNSHSSTSYVLDRKQPIIAQSTQHATQSPSGGRKMNSLSDFARCGFTGRCIATLEEGSRDIAWILGDIWVVTRDGSIHVLKKDEESKWQLAETLNVQKGKKTYKTRKVISTPGGLIIASIYRKTTDKLVEINSEGVVLSVLSQNKFLDISTDDGFVFGLTSSFSLGDWARSGQITVHERKKKDWKTIETIPVSTYFESFSVHRNFILLGAIDTLYSKAKVVKLDLRNGKEFDIESIKDDASILTKDIFGTVLLKVKDRRIVFHADGFRQEFDLSFGSQHDIKSAFFHEKGGMLYVLFSDMKLVVFTVKQ